MSPGEMRTVVLLLATLVTLARGDLKIFSNSYAESLDIICEFEETSPSDLELIISLAIVKYGQSVDTSASLNAVGVVKNNFTEAAVSGHVDLDPVFTTTPADIQEGLTTSLILECSMSNLAVHDVDEVDRVDIYHVFNGVSHLLFSSAENLTDSEWALLGGYYDRFQTFYYEVGKQYPTSKDAGTYQCDVTASKFNKLPLHIILTANVTVSTPTKQNIFDSICPQEGLQDYVAFVCNFENGPCGLNVSAPGDSTGWKIMQTRLFGRPLSLRKQDTSGHFLQIISPLPWNRHWAVETKPIQGKGRPVCVAFWISRGDHFDYNVEVYLRSINGTLERDIYYSSNIFEPWVYRSYHFSQQNQPFVVGLAVTGGSLRLQGYFAIDDLIISDLNCNEMS